MPRTLVTGGAGFLGSHLCERLLRDGHEVVCLDTYLTGTAANIDHLRETPSFFSIESDVTQPLHVDGPLDHVLHLASPASPKDYYRHGIHTLKVGALGTHHALGLAKAKGATFLLASTSEVYGDPEVNPQPETYWGHVNPIGPRSVYDEAKRYAEAMTMAYYRTHGLDIRIARIFNTYGPRMRTDDGRVLPNFIGQALRGEPLTVYGDGSQTRSFCYVDDLIDGLVRLLNSTETQPVNLGNPEKISIGELANEVIEMSASDSVVEFERLPEDDPKVRQPDIGRANSILGWKPLTERDEGLRKTISYVQKMHLSSAVGEE